MISVCRLSTIFALAALIGTQTVQASPSAGNKKPLPAATSSSWNQMLKAAFDSNISGNTDEAYSKYRAAVAAAEKAQDWKGVISCLCALADFLDSRNVMQDQESPRKRALELAEHKFGKESPEYGQELARMAGWYAKTGSLAPARSDLEKSQTILGSTDTKYPMEKASWYVANAHLKVAEGSLSQADESFKKALALKEEKLGPNQPSVLKTCREYAVLLDKLGRKAEADKMRERVEKAKGPETTRTAKGSQKGSFLDAVEEAKSADLSNDKAKALAAWKKAVDEAGKRPDLDNQLPFALVRLGDEYRASNQADEALKIYKRALGLREKFNGSNTLGMARNLERLALCYNAMRKWSESETLLKQALEIEQKVQASDQIIATTMESLLPACMANKDTKEAELIAKQLLAISNKQSGAAAANNKRIATGVLGSIYIQTGRVDEGVKMMKEMSSTPADANAYKARKAEIEKKTDQSELK